MERLVYFNTAYVSGKDFWKFHVILTVKYCTLMEYIARKTNKSLNEQTRLNFREQFSYQNVKKYDNYPDSSVWLFMSNRNSCQFWQKYNISSAPMEKQNEGGVCQWCK